MNENKRYNFLINNYIHFGTMMPKSECEKNLSLISDYEEQINNFYLNSNKSMDEFINTVNSSQEMSIVFVAGRAFPMLARLALTMKKKGYKTYLILMNEINNNSYLLVKDSFDHIIQNVLYFPALKKILNSISPNFFHVQCWMWSLSLGRFIIEQNKKSKVICDFYDVTGMYAERESLKIIFNEEVVDQDFECEEFIFKYADGIISRYKKKVFLEYLQKYKRTKNILEFQQYPLNNNIIENENKVQEKTKVQMVYCGTLIPPHDPNHPKEFFPPAGMKDAFEILLSKGYEVYIYLPINGNFEFNKWIFDLKKKKYPDSLFILESLPFDELIKKISSYDYGINLQNIDLKNSKVSNFNFSGGMGTKTFTYLEAGLPILVNSETKYSKEIIEKNKIGISLNSNELNKIDHILKNVNYSELKKNVKRFNKINNLYIKGNELVSFYESL